MQHNTEEPPLATTRESPCKSAEEPVQQRSPAPPQENLTEFQGDFTHTLLRTSANVLKQKREREKS